MQCCLEINPYAWTAHHASPWPNLIHPFMRRIKSIAHLGLFAYAFRFWTAIGFSIKPALAPIVISNNKVIFPRKRQASRSDKVPEWNCLLTSTIVRLHDSRIWNCKHRVLRQILMHPHRKHLDCIHQIFVFYNCRIPLQQRTRPRNKDGRHQKMPQPQLSSSLFYGIPHRLCPSPGGKRQPWNGANNVSCKICPVISDKNNQCQRECQHQQKSTVPPPYGMSEVPVQAPAMPIYKKSDPIHNLTPRHQHIVPSFSCRKNLLCRRHAPPCNDFPRTQRGQKTSLNQTAHTVSLQEK